MANKNRVQVVTKWVLNGGTWEPEILAHLPTGVAITDVTGQPDDSIPPTPNVYIAEIDGLTAVQLTALKAGGRVKVISEQTYDDASGDVVSDDRKGKLNAAALNTLKADLKALFADVKDTDLDLRGQDRDEVISTLKGAWKHLPKDSKGGAVEELPIDIKPQVKK